MRSISSSRRQELDRRVRRLPDLAAGFEPVHFRHADVEHDEVVDVAVEAGQRLLAVLGNGNRHPRLLEREADDVSDMRVVVDDEDGVGHVRASLCC